ncbi:hypothetical protein [Virgibacillus salexigens]|uniref:hypothetical protein n=1 Tax=Virgibacillus massiliensis TaxID=1462526 RepID=UPI00136D30B5|nr:hypothetical protein [Virgibacillus massiliensis]MYL43985.1 hypothetical protein [Virgibacillus massiliensis]
MNKLVIGETGVEKAALCEQKDYDNTEKTKAHSDQMKAYIISAVGLMLSLVFFVIGRKRNTGRKANAYYVGRYLNAKQRNC